MELVENLGMSRQAATKHLVILEEAGLITSCTKGRHVVRELDAKVLREAGHWLTARAEAWECKLDALKKLVE